MHSDSAVDKPRSHHPGSQHRARRWSVIYLLDRADRTARNHQARRRQYQRQRHARQVQCNPGVAFDNGTHAKSNATPGGRHLNATAYPNPCTDYLKIKTGDIESTNAKIQIIDSKGSTISTTETATSDNGELTIDFSSLAQGKYIIRIITNYCTYTATAIKI